MFSHSSKPNGSAPNTPSHMLHKYDCENRPHLRHRLDRIYLTITAHDQSLQRICQWWWWDGVMCQQVNIILYITTSLGCFCPWTNFRKNGLDKLPQTSSVWDLHTILMIISRSVPVLATDSPCGVWGRGWKSDMMKRDLSFDFCLYSCFMHCPNCLLFFLSYWFTLK